MKYTFGGNPHPRTHIGYNKEENVLVYDYLKSDLLQLVHKYPASTYHGSEENSTRGRDGCEWHAHEEPDTFRCDIYVKPDNIMLNWYADENDSFILEKVVLGGNCMWRSTEGQFGKRIGKPVEVFSFGLLCLFVITGIERFHLDFANIEIEPEPVILLRLLSAFGKPPDGLITHIGDEYATKPLRGLWESFEEQGIYEPFEHWPEEKFPNLDQETKRLILRMTNLDPAKRASMAEVMKDPYWNGLDGLHVFDGKRA